MSVPDAAGWSLPKWHPVEPEQYVVLTYEGEPWDYFVITDHEDRGDAYHVTTKGIGVLLADYPLPYPPPGLTWLGGRRPKGFAYHWRPMHYVFQLPEPRGATPLGQALASPTQSEALQYVRTCRDLARSRLLSGDEDAWIRINPQSNGVEFDFPDRDVQAGFSVLLRQCSTPSDKASFTKVRNALSSAYNADGNESMVTVLRTWRAAERKMLARSLDELMYDTLVEREGWHPLSRRHRLPPADLINRYLYGDLIHYGRHSDSVPADDAGHEAAQNRFDFLTASLALAHFYIGFGELIEAALGVTERS